MENSSMVVAQLVRHQIESTSIFPATFLQSDERKL